MRASIPTSAKKRRSSSSAAISWRAVATSRGISTYLSAARAEALRERVLMPTDREDDDFELLTVEPFESTDVEPADRVIPEVGRDEADAQPGALLVDLASLREIDSLVDLAEVRVEVAIVLALIGREEVRGDERRRRVDLDAGRRRFSERRRAAVAAVAARLRPSRRSPEARSRSAHG